MYQQTHLCVELELFITESFLSTFSQNAPKKFYPQVLRNNCSRQLQWRRAAEFQSRADEEKGAKFELFSLKQFDIHKYIQF
jgi:Ni,Fe-hydrogenase I small subunit